MQPTQGDVHVNVPLTNISIAYFQEETNFVATRVFPNIPVMKQSDRYYRYDRGDFNRDEMTIRAAGAESDGSGYRLDNTPTYFADVWALHKDIPDQVLANTDSMLAPELEATRFLVTKALISKERQWAAAFFGTGIWGTEYSGASTPVVGTSVLYWDDPLSTPIEDIRAMSRSIHLKSGGYKARKLVLGAYVWDKLQDHPDFIDRVKYGQTQPNPAQVTKQLIAALLELDEILVMEGIYNAAAESGGVDSGGTFPSAETNTYIGSKSALLVYSASAPGLMTPTAGYTFSWTGLFGQGALGNRIKSFRIEPKEVTRIELSAAYALKLVDNALGGFWLNVVS